MANSCIGIFVFISKTPQPLLKSVFPFLLWNMFQWEYFRCGFLCWWDRVRKPQNMPVKKLAEIINLAILLRVLMSFLNLSTDLPSLSASRFCTFIVIWKVNNAKKNIARKEKMWFFPVFFFPLLLFFSISLFFFLLIHLRIGTETTSN